MGTVREEKGVKEIRIDYVYKVVVIGDLASEGRSAMEFAQDQGLYFSEASTENEIVAFLILFIENARLLKERSNEALQKMSQASKNLSEIQELQSKVESYNKKKENVHWLEVDVHERKSEINAAID